MKTIEELEYASIAETKARLSEKIRRVVDNNRRFAITSHGKPKAVLISYKNYIALTSNQNKTENQEKVEDMSARDKKTVIKSVTSRFDEKLLSRKGQKDYKNEKIRKK